jgi:hypothetical protein
MMEKALSTRLLGNDLRKISHRDQIRVNKQTPRFRILPDLSETQRCYFPGVVSFFSRFWKLSPSSQNCSSILHLGLKRKSMCAVQGLE